jgi:hypothetical protein
MERETGTHGREGIRNHSIRIRVSNGLDRLRRAILAPYPDHEQREEMRSKVLIRDGGN